VHVRGPTQFHSATRGVEEKQKGKFVHLAFDNVLVRTATLQFDVPDHLQDMVRIDFADGHALAPPNIYPLALRRWLVETTFPKLAEAWLADVPACLDWSELALDDIAIRKRLGLGGDAAIDDDLRIAYAQDLLHAAYTGDLADERDGRCWPVLVHADLRVADAVIATVLFVAKAGAEPKADPDAVGIFHDLAAAHAALRAAGYDLNAGPDDVVPAAILAHWQH
jgi:hypothetical protein